jgi:hypothetical protein
MIMSFDAPACVHRTLEGNIQEFVLKEVSRRALDELFDMTEKALSKLAPDQQSTTGYPVLIDSTVGLQSLNYAFIRMRTVVSKFPNQKQGRVALLLPSSPLLRTVAIIMRPLAPVRLYSANEREAALAWLREAISIPSPREER